LIYDECKRVTIIHDAKTAWSISTSLAYKYNLSKSILIQKIDITSSARVTSIASQEEQSKERASFTLSVVLISLSLSISETTARNEQMLCLRESSIDRRNGVRTESRRRPLWRSDVNDTRDARQRGSLKVHPVVKHCLAAPGHLRPCQPVNQSLRLKQKEGDRASRAREHRERKRERGREEREEEIGKKK